MPVLRTQERRPVFLRLLDDDDVEPVHEPFDLCPLMEPHVGPARPGVVGTKQVHDEVPARLGAVSCVSPEAIKRLRRTEVVRDQDAVLDVVGGDYPARALDVLKPGGILVSTQPSALASLAERAAERGIRLAGIIVEADEVGMSGLADLAATGKLVPTIAATFPLEEASAASAMADVAATDGRFPLEEGGAGETGKHGPGKVVLTLV
jgi:NADPH:quinone reductase-like Zn-dependent oxidoreductase